MASRFDGALTLLLAIGAVCMIGSVLPIGCATSENACQFNSDCSQAYCLNGKCTQDCVDSALDCPEGDICNAIAQCEESNTGGGGAGGTSVTTSSSEGAGGRGGNGGNGGALASSTGASNASSANGSTTITSGPTTSGGPMGMSHELDLCDADADCASPLLCRALTVGGPMRCTRTCSQNLDCMSGTVCELIQGTKLCAGDDVGRSCNAAATCNFACLVAQQYCTVECQTGSDCPNGYGCMPVSGTNVCVKAEAPCDPDDTSACIAPAACDTTLLVGGCTLVCNTAADCPRRGAGLPPWSCDAGGICRRPPDVFGPLENGATPAQYACNASEVVVNLCNDAEHIDFEAFNIPSPPAVNCSATTATAGEPTDSCVDSCRYQGGCPFGFGCTAVGGVGNARVGLCLPAGAGEVGASCGTDGDCVFAYCLMNKCSRDCTQDGVCPSGSSCVAGSGPGVEGVPFRRCQ